MLSKYDYDMAIMYLSNFFFFDLHYGQDCSNSWQVMRINLPGLFARLLSVLGKMSLCSYLGGKLR